MLRTADQSKGDKKMWQLNASYTVGKTPTASGVISVGIVDNCPKKSKITNLGADNTKPKPQLAGDGWKFKIIPVDANAKDCNKVYFQLVGNNKYAGKYVAHSTDCKNQGAFSWAAKSSSKTLQWQLKQSKN